MDALKAIQTRRSIRKYTKQPIEKEKIEILLKAAMSAPSAGDLQPWDFIVITQREKIKEIRQVHRYAKPLEGAPLCIIVCGALGRKRVWTNKLRKLLRIRYTYWVLACAAAVENMLIAAHAIGLGAVWIGIYPEQDRIRYISNMFGLPRNIRPMAVISIGYPAQVRDPVDRFNEGYIHWEKW